MIASRPAGKHLEGILKEPCPVRDCFYESKYSTDKYCFSDLFILEYLHSVGKEGLFWCLYLATSTIEE